MKQNGHESNITISANTNTLKAVLILENGYQVDATKSVLVATITGLSTASVVCLSTIVASPAVTAVEAVSLGTALPFVVCGIVRSNLAPRADKHEKLKILAEKKAE